MERIDYNIEDRDTVLADLAAQGKQMIEDVTINIVDGVLQTCYCIIQDAEVTE
jgi:hypothetical protein